MNAPFISSTRRRLLDEREQLADHRSDTEKLRDCVDRHLANRAALDAVLKPPYTMCERLSEEFGKAEAAFMDSEAEMIRLLEDITLVSYSKLQKAVIS